MRILRKWVSIALRNIWNAANMFMLWHSIETNGLRVNVLVVIIWKNITVITFFVVAVNEKLLSIPIQFKNCRIGQNPKVGRKPKAKKGDALKRN